MDWLPLTFNLWNAWKSSDSNKLLTTLRGSWEQKEQALKAKINCYWTFFVGEKRVFAEQLVTLEEEYQNKMLTYLIALDGHFPEKILSSFFRSRSIHVSSSKNFSLFRFGLEGIPFNIQKVYLHLTEPRLLFCHDIQLKTCFSHLLMVERMRLNPMTKIPLLIRLKSLC